MIGYISIRIQGYTRSHCRYLRKKQGKRPVEGVLHGELLRPIQVHQVGSGKVAGWLRPEQHAVHDKFL